MLLHGLPGQKVPWQQSVDRDGASHDLSVLTATGGPPQAGVLGPSTPPQHVTSACLASPTAQASNPVTSAAAVVVVPVGRVVSDGVGGAATAHSRLVGVARGVGLPAGSRP